MIKRSNGDRDRHLTSRQRAVLLVLCGAIFLEGMDVSMLGVALPSIGADLEMSTESLQWVVSAYVLGYGGFMLLGGRAADLLGRRQMLLAWLVVFVVFSAVGGIAGEGWLLIAARFATGVSAAFLTPAGLSIITTIFPEGPARTKALLIYAGTASAGFSLGLVAGGLLTSISWRWVFLTPVILASGVLVAAFRVVPETSRPAASDRRFDLAGASTVTGAMILLVFTVVRLPEVPWSATALTLGVSVVLLAAFIAIERRSAAPLIRLSVFRVPSLVRANLAAMLFLGASFGFQFIAILFMQQVRGWSALQTGLALMVVSIDAILAPTLTPRLVARFGNLRVILAGAGIAFLAYAMFLRIDADWGYWAMLPSVMLLGIGFALAYGPLTIAATEGLPENEQGLASGLVNTSFQFGAALGLAIVTAVMVSQTGSSGSPSTLLDGYRAALVVPAAAAAAAALIILHGLLPRRPRPLGGP